MEPPEKTAYIKAEHQERLIAGLRQFHERIVEFSGKYLEESGLRARVARVAQFVVLLLLALTFGLASNTPYSLLQAPSFREVREYVTQIDGRFPGKSTAVRRVGRILYACRDSGDLAAALESVALAFINFYYVAVGHAARAAFQAVLGSTRASVTPPAECFVGVAKASELFPSLGAAALGRVMPYFNAWVYKQARRGTSTSELVGDLRRPSIEGGRVLFKDAGELGFVAGVPALKAFFAQFKFIEQNIGPAWDLANRELVRLKAHDLTATTADGTSVPVDKRDKTGSIGTGSRGTFSGQCDGEKSLHGIL